MATHACSAEWMQGFLEPPAHSVQVRRYLHKAVCFSHLNTSWWHLPAKHLGACVATTIAVAVSFFDSVTYFCKGISDLLISVIICDIKHILPIIQNNGSDAIHSFKFAAFGVFLIAAALFFPENILSMMNYDPPLTQEDVENLFSIIHRQNARIDEQEEVITTRSREYSQVVTDRDHLQNAVVPGLREGLSARSNALEEITRIAHRLST